MGLSRLHNYAGTANVKFVFALGRYLARRRGIVSYQLKFTVSQIICHAAEHF
jgi:hypothetical protein